MGDARYYRAQAEFCVEMASAIKRPDYAERWYKLADQWRELAEEADRSGQQQPRRAS